jgi:hypothetical protein
MAEETSYSLESKKVSTTFRGILHFPHSIDASLSKQTVYDGKGAATSLKLGGGTTGADIDGDLIISGNTIVKNNLSLSGNAIINGDISLISGGNINDITVGSSGSGVTSRVLNELEAGKLRVRDSNISSDYEIVFGNPNSISNPDLFSIKVNGDLTNNFYIKHRPFDFDSTSPFWINRSTGEVNIKNLKVTNLISVPDTITGLPPGNQPLDSKRNIIPVGAIFMFPSLVVPVGWFECDGRELNSNDYPELFSILQYNYSTVTSGFLFKIPDLRGLFVRGLDHDTTSTGGSVATGRDPDVNRGLNNIQQDAFKSHTHGDSMWLKNIPSGASPLMGDPGGTPVDYYSKLPYVGGNETRPKNIALVYCIKW